MSAAATDWTPEPVNWSTTNFEGLVPESWCCILERHGLHKRDFDKEVNGMTIYQKHSHSAGLPT